MWTEFQCADGNAPFASSACRSMGCVIVKFKCPTIVNLICPTSVNFTGAPAFSVSPSARPRVALYSRTRQSLWRPNFTSQRVTLIRLPIRDPDPTSPDKELEPTDGWIPLSDLNPQKGTRPPAKIRFWDDQEVSLGSWKEIEGVGCRKVPSYGCVT